MTGSRLDFVLRGAAAAAHATAQPVVRWLDELVDTLLARDARLMIVTGRPTSGSLSEEAWERTLRAFVAGQLDSVGVVANAKNDSEGENCVAVHCQGLKRGVLHPDVAEIMFSVEFGDRPLLGVDEYVARCVELAEVSRLAQGLLLPWAPARRLAAGQTRVDELAMRARISIGPRALAQFSRGPGWGVWLTDGHVRGLGGRDALEHAPVARVVERLGGVWLELTESPFAIPDHALRALESFLAPILPTVDDLRAADQGTQVTQSTAVSVQPPSESDAYAEYWGPLVPVTWRANPAGAPELVVNVDLHQPPSPDAAAALGRAAKSWCLAGAAGRYRPARANVRSGGFRAISDVTWDGSTARWYVDPGSADVAVAVADLARRLGGWMAAWGQRIAAVRLGEDPP
jgi:hypothetical protein